jgi:protease IV
MAQFFKYLFASCLGTALALALLIFIGIGTISSLASSVSTTKKPTVSANSVLELNFEQPIPERTNNLPMDPFDVENANIPGLQEIVEGIRQAKNDPDIKGIYMNASMVMTGKATSSVLRRELVDFRQSGKFIISYANFYTQNAYYLASVADSVFLNPIGGVDFRGLSSTIAYYKGLLDKMDVQMRIFYAGQFKSATEPLRMDKMSEQNRLQVREYLAGLYQIMLRDIGASRQISESDLRAIADRYDGRNAQKSLEVRLIDRIAYEDEAFNAAKTRIGLDKNDKLKRVKLSDYIAAKPIKRNLSIKDKIAVVYAEGSILDGKKGDPGDTYDGEYVKMLRKIRADDRVKAIVLRINSPGGSVLASENIYRELELCRQAGKPVVATMGDVAASGGYYIACLADSIFAEPNTITGSIGVFGVIPILQNTMKNKLGVTYDTVRTGKFSAFGTPFIDFSPEESAMIQTEVEQTYQEFLRKVATGRHRRVEEIDAIAQGRVWTGVKAKEIGLVDELGNLDRAIQAAAKLAGLEKYRTVDYPRTKSGLEQFMDRFTKNSGDDAVVSRIARRELSELYPVYQMLREAKNGRLTLQARLPYELIIR